MKVHKPIKLFVPTSIWNIIDANVKTDKEKYVYIIHYILLLPVRDKRNENFVQLSKEKLKHILGCNLIIYIKFLEKYELIECDKIYIPKKKTYYYRIHPKHKFDCNYYELQHKTKLFKCLIKQVKNDKANYNLLQPFLCEMRKEFMNLQLDYKGAINYIETITDNKKQLSYAIAINQLHDVRFRYFKRNKTNNRLDTNLTNLKKELRQFIIGDYVSIDLKNSQPFFLSFLFENLTKILNHFILKKLEININNIEIILNNKHLPYCYRFELENLVKTFGIKAFKKILLIHKKSNFSYFMNLSLFKRWVCEGSFYDEFVIKFENQFTRNDIKKIMFEVLFSKNECHINYRKFVPFEKEKKIFSSVFPVIYEIIERLKDTDNAKLAIYLQRLESKIFIDTIAKGLTENGIIPLTIHDSVIVPAFQQEKALNIMQSVFKQEIGIIPAFSIEKLNKYSNA